MNWKVFLILTSLFFLNTAAAQVDLSYSDRKALRRLNEKARTDEAMEAFMDDDCWQVSKRTGRKIPCDSSEEEQAPLTQQQHWCRNQCSPHYANWIGMQINNMGFHGFMSIPQNEQGLRQCLQCDVQDIEVFLCALLSAIHPNPSNGIPLSEFIHSQESSAEESKLESFLMTHSGKCRQNPFFNSNIKIMGEHMIALKNRPQMHSSHPQTTSSTHRARHNGHEGSYTNKTGSHSTSRGHPNWKHPPASERQHPQSGHMGGQPWGALPPMIGDSSMMGPPPFMGPQQPYMSMPY